ncbi:uncharacterized protein LOC131060216 [Cryptomeria japonica]|uniref:uncharacterized protein LOC131060216 n=1 Tax=Cryptomeria japonica TaxID=3369 RepID=UPI0027DA0D8B|nr:uncharacterized protein LOC131060216 [Cryptomeria japonica]
MEWAKCSNQNSAMLLLDFEKAYDRIEWKFILMMLEAFGFPSFFCSAVQTLLKDASAQVEINGILSPSFPLSRSIRQGCPLAPALFVISSEALFYILRDASLSPVVKGISLPNNDMLINCQFADDTALFFELSEENFSVLKGKLDLFCSASGARISPAKSICLGWEDQPPEWFSCSGLQWGGPKKIVKYLGIPFSVDPGLRSMWLWVRDKILNKLNKWHNRTLSLAGRIQVCQKIFSSYSIYYSSAWLFSNYQIQDIQSAIRSFLWSDGKGNKKCHAVRWAWCHVDKSFGGLGLKDLKLQGIALSAKWIFLSLNGDCPWKVLVRHNIERGYPKKAKSWKNLPFGDLLLGEFPVAVQGSMVFKAIWKAWEQVRDHIMNKSWYHQGSLHGERSIWWNLVINGKPLALMQGCSARSWAKKGIKQFADLFEGDLLPSWDAIKSKFDIPDSQRRTYNMVRQASRHLPSVCNVDSLRHLHCLWPGGVAMDCLKAKHIHSVINQNKDIFSHVNSTWHLSLDDKMWSKVFQRLWKSPVEPKINCFRWLVLLDRLPIKRFSTDSDSHFDLCNLCKVPETGKHILFYCLFAKEIWNRFGIIYPFNMSILNIISGYVPGLHKDSNLFWNMLSSNILWQIWKCRNEEKFQGKPRVLTEFFRKLTHFKNFLQVHVTMMVERKKLKRFIQCGASFYFHELKNGPLWRRTLDDLHAFEVACEKIKDEIRKNGNPRLDELSLLAQVQAHKDLVWMDGPLGWVAWVDRSLDILS